jgi:nitroreductase
MIKKIIKYILPKKVYNFLKINKVKLKTSATLILAYLYDYKRYYYYSDIKGSDTSTKLIGKIIREYHVIEKGLTMPQTRFGFGKDIIVSICNHCEDYISKYGNEEEQLKHAIGVILEYKHFHDEHNHELDTQIVSAIDQLKIKAKGVNVSSQKRISKEEYFKYSESHFSQFSNSRSSVRNYTNEDIPLEKIINVLTLVRNTPSACNRQPWRTYVFINKEKINEILEIQGGNRGFGHLTNKLILITAELGGFSGLSERNQAYIDGGIYAMNILYALHYHQIAACIMNCSTSPEKDKQLRSLCRIKESEVFIAMVACGIPPEIFMVAASKRYELERTNTLII